MLIAQRKQCLQASQPVSVRPASRPSRLNSNPAGLRFSELNRLHSICMHGFPDRDSEAWSPTLYRLANFPAPIPMATRIRRRLRYKRLFLGPIDRSFFGNLQRLYSLRRGNPAMAINGRRNKPIGPGGSTRRLHQSLGRCRRVLAGAKQDRRGCKGRAFARHGSADIGPKS